MRNLISIIRNSVYYDKSYLILYDNLKIIYADNHLFHVYLKYII